MSLDPSKRANKRRRTSPSATTTGADIAPSKDPISVDDLDVSHVVSYYSLSKEGMDSGKYSLSPSKRTKSVEEAEQQAAADGFKQSDLGPMKYFLVLYLYGTEYFNDIPYRRTRKKKIKAFIKTKARVSRLEHVALSPMADTVPQDEKAFESYLGFVTVCELVFANDKSSRGFPGIPYLRLQQSKNCYIAASAMFVSLYMQKQNPDQKPLDVGWVARRYVTNTMERLEQRVIHNKGGNSKVLVENIIGGEFAETAMRTVPMNIEDSQDTEELLEEGKQKIERHLKKDRYGLVSKWRVPQKWREIGKQNAQKQLGIWKFTGSSTDSEGIFVTFNSVLNQNKRDELLALWRDAIPSVPMDGGENNLGFNSNVGISQEEDEGNEGSDTEEQNDNAKASSHAMVLLGYTTMDGETLYVLLNTWKKMPLILVSFDYMVACKCQITFLDQDLPENFLEEKKECGLLAAECSHPDYVEEGCYVEGEADYEIEEEA